MPNVKLFKKQFQTHQSTKWYIRTTMHYTKNLYLHKNDYIQHDHKNHNIIMSTCIKSNKNPKIVQQTRLHHKTS